LQKFYALRRTSVYLLTTRIFTPANKAIKSNYSGM